MGAKSTPVTILDNRPIQHHRHMVNNAIGIWATTLLAYGQQRHRDMTNNGSVIWGTTISAYDKQRQRDITNNGAGICALPHKSIPGARVRENENHNHSQGRGENENHSRQVK
jgi:hypothetical protein